MLANFYTSIQINVQNIIEYAYELNEGWFLRKYDCLTVEYVTIVQLKTMPTVASRLLYRIYAGRRIQLTKEVDNIDNKKNAGWFLVNDLSN